MIYTVLVEHTDRTRAGQHFTAYQTTVHVEAQTDHEATLVAAQMVAAIRCDLDGMVTATTITEVLL